MARSSNFYIERNRMSSYLSIMSLFLRNGDILLLSLACSTQERFIFTIQHCVSESMYIKIKRVNNLKIQNIMEKSRVQFLKTLEILNTRNHVIV